MSCAALAKEISGEGKAMRKTWIRALVLVLVLLLAAAGCGGKQAAQKPKIVVGSKQFTEQQILGEMVAALLEDAGYPVERKIGLGGTGVVHQALVSGDVNVYVEYTGTGLTAILKLPVMTDPDQVYEKVKEEYKAKWDLHWLKPWGFNNTYCITIRKEDADKLGVKTISDLVPHAGQMVFACTHEFATRPDGLPGLEKAYGIKFKEVKSMDPGLMYQAIAEKQVDAIGAFATDGRIPALGLFNLVDDKHYFPPYYAAPVVRGDLLKKAPEVADILNKLAGAIDDATMAQLNLQVDQQKKAPADVARSFLKERGLIKK